MRMRDGDGDAGATEFLRITIPGLRGKRSGGQAPTLGIIGRLGGVGARPDITGFVSDGDGAATALAVAVKLSAMASRGERLVGDVIVATHIDPDAPTIAHEPVPFMNSVVGIAEMNAHEVCAEMDAIVSIDTTKGNRLLNHRGIAITPTAKDGYVLRVSEDLLDVLETVTGEPAYVMPITQQDITPYGNGLHHVNSIMQPATATSVPVVGLALTTVTAVAGCATGASHPWILRRPVPLRSKSLRGSARVLWSSTIVMNSTESSNSTETTNGSENYGELVGGLSGSLFAVKLSLPSLEQNPPARSDRLVVPENLPVMLNRMFSRGIDSFQH